MSDARPLPRPFADTMPMVLLRARETLLEPLRPILRDYQLTDQQWRVLRVLGQAGPLETTALAEAVVMYPASVTRVVRTLAGRGYLSREPLAADRRVQVVAISPAGRALLEEVVPLMVRLGAEVRERYGAEKLEQLRTMLLEMIEVA